MTTSAARPIHPQRATSSRYVQLGAVMLAAGGLAWAFKASAILLTGWQPPQALEAGQALCALGVLLVGIGLVPRAIRLVGAATALAALALAARLAASLYEQLPGAVISTGDEFVFPYSPLVLIASIRGLLALALLGVAWWRVAKAGPRRWAVPLAAGLAPLPAALTALVDVEWPILVIGAAWIAADATFWREAPPGQPSHPKGSA